MNLIFKLHILFKAAQDDRVAYVQPFMQAKIVLTEVQAARGDTTPDLETALLPLEAGEICPDVVRTRYGVHVGHLDRKVDGSALPFEQVRNALLDVFIEALVLGGTGGNLIHDVAADCRHTIGSPDDDAILGPRLRQAPTKSRRRPGWLLNPQPCHQGDHSCPCKVERRVFAHLPCSDERWAGWLNTADAALRERVATLC